MLYSFPQFSVLMDMLTSTFHSKCLLDGVIVSMNDKAIPKMNNRLHLFVVSHLGDHYP